MDVLKKSKDITTVRLQNDEVIKVLDGQMEKGYEIEGYSNYYINLKGDICCSKTGEKLKYTLEFDHELNIPVKVYILFNNKSELTKVRGHEFISRNVKSESVRENYIMFKNKMPLDLSPLNFIYTTEEDARKHYKSLTIGYALEDKFNIHILNEIQHTAKRISNLDLNTCSSIANVEPEVILWLIKYGDSMFRNHIYNNMFFSVYGIDGDDGDVLRNSKGYDVVVENTKTGESIFYSNNLSKVATVMSRSRSDLERAIADHIRRHLSGVVMSGGPNKDYYKLYLKSQYGKTYKTYKG